jgi:hypothetical protein
MTMEDTVNQPRKLTEAERADEAARIERALSGQQRPRSLQAIIEQAARLVNCGQCWARPGTPCDGADGYHVARFCRASRKGLLTGQDMATVFETAGVFTNATIIRDGAR